MEQEETTEAKVDRLNKYFKEALIAHYPRNKRMLNIAAVYATSIITGLSIAKTLEHLNKPISELYREAAKFSLNSNFKESRESIQGIIEKKYEEEYSTPLRRDSPFLTFSGEIKDEYPKRHLS